MISAKREKEKERFYLFAGMGGRSLRRKNKIFLVWSLVAACIASLLVAVILYFINRNY